MNCDKLPSLSSFHHRVPLQIRFNDIDILGHLNNTVYFSFFDTGKAWYLKELLGERMTFRKVETVIANVDCAYVAPIYFGEKIEVLTRCSSIHDRSFVLQQVIVHSETGQIKAAAESVMVSFNAETQTSTEMPPYIRQALEKDLEHI